MQDYIWVQLDHQQRPILLMLVLMYGNQYYEISIYDQMSLPVFIEISIYDQMSLPVFIEISIYD